MCCVGDVSAARDDSRQAVGAGRWVVGVSVAVTWWVTWDHLPAVAGLAAAAAAVFAVLVLRCGPRPGGARMAVYLAALVANQASAAWRAARIRGRPWPGNSGQTPGGVSTIVNPSRSIARCLRATIGKGRALESYSAITLSR